MRLLQRLAQRGISVPIAKAAGEGLGQRRIRGVERGADPTPQHTLRDLFSERVNGHDAAGVEEVILVAREDFVVRVLERETFIGTDGACEQDERAGREGPSEKTSSEPRGFNLARVVLEAGLGEGHAPAQTDRARRDDLGLNRDRIALGDLTDRCRPAPVLIVSGEMEEKVAQAGETEIGQ